ncbi:hypothetical protein D7X88_04110 [bacterium C-53]|nr:hypothetical protein [Lachnospiraceae bacterium]NBI02414.1 hypothetical protein [Lachnospiraceae bacterium]RKJ11520.1 hypothetical protein D7X88_04110 [bacterium C-53]
MIGTNPVQETNEAAPGKGFYANKERNPRIVVAYSSGILLWFSSGKAHAFCRLQPAFDRLLS